MAQFYTLEEAARVLGMGPDELSQKAQQREVRGFMDGGTWQFRTSDIEELARKLGQGSEPDLSLPDLDLGALHAAGDASEGNDFDLSEFHLDAAEAPLESGGEHEILLDEGALPPAPHGNSSSTIIGLDKAPIPGLPSASDIRLAPSDSGVVIGPSVSDITLAPSDSGVTPAPAPSPGPNPGRTVSDSDVSLAPAGPAASDIRLVPSGSGLSDSDVTLFHESADSASSLGEPVKPGSPRIARPPGSSAEVRTAGKPSYDEDSDFELAASDALPDDGSDFELTALESGDDFETIPRSPGASDVTGFLPSASGIDLARPSDSGINLQGASGLNPHLSGLGSSPAPSPRKNPNQDLLSATSLGKAPDLLSATSLPTAAEKNLFDDTDFEVDVVESDDSRTVQLDAASDFDLNESGSDHTSEVFAVDEDDVDVNAATALRASPVGASSSGAVAADWSDDSSPAAGALRPRAGSREEAEPAAFEDEGAPAPAVRLASASASQAEWGGLWVGLLGVATVTTALLAFVCMDLALNVHAGRGGSLYYGLAKQLAGLIGTGS